MLLYWSTISSNLAMNTFFDTGTSINVYWFYFLEHYKILLHKQIFLHCVFNTFEHLYHATMILLIYCKTRYRYLPISYLVYDQIIRFLSFKGTTLWHFLKISITIAKIRFLCCICLSIWYLQDHQTKCYLKKINVL